MCVRACVRVCLSEGSSFQEELDITLLRDRGTDPVRSLHILPSFWRLPSSAQPGKAPVSLFPILAFPFGA